MSIDQAAARRGRIDAAGPLAAIDLVSLAGDESGWPKGYLAGGFGADASAFRRTIEQWGFAGLGRVADAGCGFGRWTPFLAEVNDQVTGFERKEEGQALGAKLAELFGLDNLVFENADLTYLPVADGAFDGVWCCNALQFVHRGQVLRELNRVLRPGGRLAILKYNGPGAVLSSLFRGYDQGGLSGHATKFALRCLKNGPGHNGRDNYGTVESVPAMLEEFGFVLQGPVQTTHLTKNRPQPGVEDLAVLAQRLETDAAFRDDFLSRPRVVDTYPISLDLVATKTRDLPPR